MAKKKIEVQGLEIRIESMDSSDYVSLTDIAKQTKNQKPIWLITNWLKNGNTLLFLEEWERVHNSNFKVGQMTDFKARVHENTYSLSPKKYIEKTNAVGLISKAGRYGGTYAHKDIALNFCYWISPPFQVWMIKEFQRLKEQEFNSRNLEWHISKITDNIEEVRNLLDTIPGQKTNRNRLLYKNEE